MSPVIIIGITSSLSHNDINIIGGLFEILICEPWAVKRTSIFKMSSTVTSHEKGYCTKCEWMITKVIIKFHDQRPPLPKSEQTFNLLQVLLSSVYSDSQKPSYRFNFFIPPFCMSIPKFTVASKGPIHDNNWILSYEIWSLQQYGILLNHWAHTYIQR